MELSFPSMQFAASPSGWTQQVEASEEVARPGQSRINEDSAESFQSHKYYWMQLLCTLARPQEASAYISTLHGPSALIYLFYTIKKQRLTGQSVCKADSSGRDLFTLKKTKQKNTEVQWRCVCRLPALKKKGWQGEGFHNSFLLCSKMLLISVINVSCYNGSALFLFGEIKKNILNKYIHQKNRESFWNATKWIAVCPCRWQYGATLWPNIRLKTFGIELFLHLGG